MPEEAATGTINVIIHVGGEEVSVTSGPDSADKITLSQLREEQKQDVGSSSLHDPTVEASRKLLRDLESQRNNLFITLCMTAELDEVECQEAVLLSKKMSVICGKSVLRNSRIVIGQ